MLNGTGDTAGNVKRRRYGFAGLANAARETFSGLRVASTDAGTELASELEEMLRRRRSRLAAEVEREALVEALSTGDVDVLAGQRLNRLLNGVADDDAG